MKKRYIFAILLLFLILIIITKKSPDTPNAISQNIDWDAIRADDVAITDKDWGTPQRFFASTEGWEEGIYISQDGNELYFIYTNIDVFHFIFYGKEHISGPIRDNDNQCTHPLMPTPHTCGKWPRADHFYTTKIDGIWTKPIPHPLTLNYPIGGLTLVGDKAYFMSGFEDDVEDIGYAIRSDGVWGEKIKIDSVSSEYTESDPYVTQDDSEMFFWSSRPAKFAKNNIYRSVKIDGEWQSPELLTEPINGDGDDMMTFLFDNYLYFGTERDGHSMAIYRSKRLGDNEWAAPELVISSKLAVGEPSITADGKYLYFEQIFTDGNGNFNPDIMYVERK